jgi:hypothetical protein
MKKDRISLAAIAVLLVAIAMIATLQQEVTANQVTEKIQVGDTFIMKSVRVIAITKEGENVVRKSAEVDLRITVTEIGSKVIKFKVEGGIVIVDKVSYEVVSGKGRIIRCEGKTLIMLGSEVKGLETSGELWLKGDFRSFKDSIGSLLKGVIRIGEVAYRLRGAFVFRRA